MLSQNDFKQIKAIVDDSLKPLKQDVSSLKTDVSGLKQDVSVLKTDVSGLKQDVSTLKTDISGLKQDMRAVKSKLDDLYDFSVDAIGNILDWTQEIHTTIVQKKLPERVERLEKHTRLPRLGN